MIDPDTTVTSWFDGGKLTVFVAIRAGPAQQTIKLSQSEAKELGLELMSEVER